MTGLNVLKKIWVKIWGEDIPPQQEVFENKNANLFKSFYTKIRNKLVFRRLAIVLFLLIATCLTFNYLKYTKFFACLGKDVCIYRGPKLASPKVGIFWAQGLITEYIQLKDKNILCLMYAFKPYNYGYHKFVSLLKIFRPKYKEKYDNSVNEGLKYFHATVKYDTFMEAKLIKLFGKPKYPTSEAYSTKKDKFYAINSPILPINMYYPHFTTNSNSEVIFYSHPGYYTNVKNNKRTIYNYKTQTQRTEPETIFNKINGEIIANKKINHNTNLYTIEDKNSNIKLYRHDTDKWTLTEVPNNLDLVLDLQKSIMLFDGNVAIASKHNSKPCSKTKICEPVVLYDVKSNKLIANNVEYKDLEANLIRLQEKDNEYFMIENTLYNGLINAFYNTIDSIVYDKKNLKIEYWYELNDKSIADTFSLDAYKIDKLLRKYTKSGLKNKPSTFAITPTKHLIWSTNQGFPTSADKWNGKKIPKELKRTVFYDSEKHIVKRGPDFMNSPIESYQISIDENKAIFIGGNENITGVFALTYTNATPYEYTQIIEVKE